MRAAARAHANIALVKYWGKRDPELNLPAAGSLSLTLEALATDTEVELSEAQERDELTLDGAPSPEPARQRAERFLDLLRARSGRDLRATVRSQNRFPTASGLASSASGYAALALAASAAFGLELTASELSELARRGSGSAARSIFGGFVIMNAGERTDGRDACAEPLDDAADWPVRMVIAIVAGGAAKEVSSRDAMLHCAETSPLYAGWLRSVPGDLVAARRAITGRDLDALGAVTEGSALAMHAAAIASRPPVVYWRPQTLACLSAVWELRKSGIPAFATMDAGPHVKVLTLDEHAGAVGAALGRIDGVTDTMVSAPGRGAHLLREPRP